ncbi:MAG: peptidase S8, partial [Cyanobacteria bacterium NC_groundwater_1444_Ag_S-0.65um_54_12]|nr:peptidase S8 [Cyanobacteria bacterium NC_groundwater_1444_Ag_S-0.65um_54_12]
MPASSKRRSSLALLAVFSLLTSCGLPTKVDSTSQLVGQQKAMPHHSLVPTVAAPRVKGQVLVRLRSGYQTRTIKGLLRPLELPGHAVIQTLPGESEEAAAFRLMRDPAVTYAEPNYLYRAFAMRTSYVPNDPLLANLWGIYKIQAPLAWNITAASSIKIAVVDTGIDYTHEDFDETHIIRGPNLANRTADPMDDMGHGTHVAGTIAALGDNSKGIVGVAYQSTLIAIKVLSSDGSGNVEDIVAGVTKAVELGANVINLSLGGSAPSLTLQDAIAEAITRGVIVVAAAGNNSSADTTYPAAYPDVIAVGATDQYDARAAFSNFGSYVKVAAPGVGILSTLNKSYKEQSGTSMAAPHVAGAVALLLSRQRNLSPAQIVTILQNTGDATTGFPYGTVTRLNLARALEKLESKEPIPTPIPAPGVPKLLLSNVTLRNLQATTTTLSWETSLVADGKVLYTT